jgi:hypothetical protein
VTPWRRSNRTPCSPAPCWLTRESSEKPFTFRGIPADVGQGGGNWTVPTSVVKLDAGDYSLDGYATAIAVERKSHPGPGTTPSGTSESGSRGNLERLNAMQVAFVVVEADWPDDP